MLLFGVIPLSFYSIFKFMSLFVFSVIFLASIGKSLGVRRLFIKLLLVIFEYGRQNIEKEKKKTRLKVGVIEDGDESDDNESDETESELSRQQSTSSNASEKSLKKSHSNGYLPNSNSVISKDSLILVPDGELTTTHTNGTAGKEPISIKSKSAAELTGYNKEDNDSKEKDSTEAEEEILDFKLSTCLDYIKAGVEAIIEDDVTSRFEAEELKNWNLLTRTNRYYEFISWRLSVLWVIGFFIRYCLLMPLRVFICFVGVAWSVVSFGIVGLIPIASVRKYLSGIAFNVTFRLIARSISAVVTFHNPQYRPVNCGFCVANHTTPIDVSILASDCVFSLVCWLTICTGIVGCFQDGNVKRWMVYKISIHCFDILSCALSTVITYHNIENRPKNGICVANHTSPIDALVLMCDNCYSLIGQRHGGFLGVLQFALNRASPHIWFERAEAKDRIAVAQRLKQHVTDPRNPPILIFPEGTCINNTSVMQFKKGSFEVGGVIYPVAIKYDPRFGDPYWNSAKYSMMQYLFLMMTSWAIVCDVWYLPPMFRREDESAIDFANRVKSVIAKQGGLVDLVWDGQLKRMQPKKEWREKQQEEFTKRLKGE